jgi:hypothetical protein
VWPAYNQLSWFYQDASFPNAPAHEVGHMLGAPDEYDISSADYTTTTGRDPTKDVKKGTATSATDTAGTTKYTNTRGIMGTGTAVEKHHLTYVLNLANNSRPKKADGTFVEPAFGLH